MSKIALINDIHFGIRNDNILFLSNQLEYWTENLIPRLVKDGITDLIVLGDLFDRRKYINFLTLHTVKQEIFNKLEELGINIHILVGNHDTYYKSTNDVNSPELLLAEYDNIMVYTKASLINIDGVDIGLIPWINEQNHDETMQFLMDVKTDIIMGHFEINGFMMYKNSIACYDGVDKSLFDRFKVVYSGHYHEASQNKQIKYLGAPSQYTWSDVDCVRGWHIFDVESHELELVENHNTLFNKVVYNESVDLMEYDFTVFSNKMVRLLVGDKPDRNNFELFVEKIRQANPYEFDVVDNTVNLYVDGDEISQEDIDNEDTVLIVKSYIDASNTDLDKDRLKHMFETLHNDVVNS